MRYTILVLIVAVVFSGCAYKRFCETLTEPGEGEDAEIKTKTSDTSYVLWPPFSKTGPVAHGLKYRWGGKASDQNEIISGQDTDAVDTTGQVQAINALGELLGTIAAQALQTYLARPATTTTGGTSGGGVTGAITTITELLEQLRALGLLKPATATPP